MIRGPHPQQSGNLGFLYQYKMSLQYNLGNASLQKVAIYTDTKTPDVPMVAYEIVRCDQIVTYNNVGYDLKLRSEDCMSFSLHLATNAQERVSLL